MTRIGQEFIMTAEGLKPKKENIGCLGVILCAFALLYGSVMSCVEDSRKENRMDAVLAEEMDVVWMLEENPDISDGIVKNCVFGINDPVASLNEGETEFRHFYKVTSSTCRIKPKFIQGYPSIDGTMSYSPVYAVFEGPNVNDKIRNWLKENSYTESEFVVEKMPVEDSRTNFILPKNGESEIDFFAFFETGGRLYMWDNGGSIDDLSEGFTSNANGGEEHYRNFVKLLHQIAE